MCGGFLYKHVNAKIVIIVSLLVGGLGVAIIPDVAPYFWIAHTGMFVSGFSVGALEVGKSGDLRRPIELRESFRLSDGGKSSTNSQARISHL